MLAQLADAYRLDGRGREAGDAYVAAAEHAHPDARIDYLRRASELYLCSAYVDRGIDVVSSVLTSLGLSFPKHRGPWRSQRWASSWWCPFYACGFASATKRRSTSRACSDRRQLFVQRRAPGCRRNRLRHGLSLGARAADGAAGWRSTAQGLRGMLDRIVCVPS
jgi:hypothetical protein